MDDHGFCQECGKVKEDKSKLYCNSCTNSYKTTYKIIKEFLGKHPRANAIEIAEKTGISIEKITVYIKDGTLGMRGR